MLTIIVNILFAFIVTLYATDSIAADPFWRGHISNYNNYDSSGKFKKDHCTFIGKRQYSAVLMGIPWGQSWENTCAATPATINGQYFAKPDRCVNTGQMWGEFDVNDDSCPRWGEWRKEACEAIPGEKGLKARRYSARLWDAPPPAAATWQWACASEPVVIGTYKRPSPQMCAGAGNIELTKAVISGAQKVSLALSGGVDVGSVADAAGAVASEINDYLKKEGAESASPDVNVVDMRTKWHELWGVVWIPESGCGLP
jgi:hypothetical protein